MKRLDYFSLGMLAVAATFSACSSSDDVAGDNPGVENAARAYINVNIVNQGETRAAEGYEDGTGAENAVGTTRFYFFAANGDAYVVGNNKSYIDYTPTYSDDPASSTDDIEETASLTIEIKPSGEYPKYLVAVLNPPTDETSKTALETNINLTNLKSHLLSPTTARTTDNFVMSNSAYATSSAIVDATELNSDAGSSVFYATAAEAEKDGANAIDVYVERVLAKVNTSITKTATKAGIYSLDSETKLGDAQIYAKILGWRLTSTANDSYLVKSLNTSWTATAPTGFDTTTPWNNPTFHRSFWAQNPEQKDKYTYNNNKSTLSVLGNSEYCLENTPYESTAYPFSSSKVIVYAQLLDASDNVLSIVRWNGTNYKENDFKKLIASSATNIKIKENESGTCTALTADDIALRYNYTSLATHKEAYKAIPTIANAKRSYIFQINGTTVTADKDATTGNVTKSVIQKVEDALSNYICNLYANGNTYYYLDITHLNKQAAVVRNHVYKITISDIQGLGTPIVDKEHDNIDDPTDPNSPEKPNYPDIPTDPDTEDGDEPIIIPEKPNDTNAYIRAKINVLSWRIVDNSSVVLK